MSSRFVFPGEQRFESNGRPVSGGKLYFYENKTSTPKDTFTDRALTTPHTNPVVADSGGVWEPIWLSGVYTVTLKDSDDVQLDSWDNVRGVPAGNAEEPESLSAMQALDTSINVDGDVVYLRGRTSVGDGGEGHFRWDSSNLSTEVASDELTGGEGDGGVYVAPDSDKTGASGAWVRQFSGIRNIKWYGAKGDGVTDDTDAIQTALDNQGENTADGQSGTYVYAPEPDVAYRFSSIAHKTVGIIGDGYDDQYRGPKDDSQYQDNSLFGGTIFRSTASSGTVMDFGKPTDGIEGSSKPPLKGFILIGETGNSATGMRLGRRLGADIQEVRVANFAKGYQFDFFEDCWFLGLRASGCDLGISIDTTVSGNNQNTFYMTECNQCDVSIKIVDGLSNIFYGGLLQGASLTDGVVLGAGCAHNAFYDIWAEAQWGGDVIRTEGDDCRRNTFKNWKFNADTSSITLDGGTGATGDHVLEEMGLPGSASMSMTVNVSNCDLRRISENISVTDNGLENSLTREAGYTGDWQHRFDYDRGQVRNLSDRAPLQFVGVDETNANQYLMRFLDNDDNEIGAVNLRNGASVEIEDDAGNRVHQFNFDGDAFHEGGRLGIRNGFLEIGNGVSEPGTESGVAKIFIDSADGDLKVKFGDGTVKVIATDT